MRRHWLWTSTSFFMAIGCLVIFAIGWLSTPQSWADHPHDEHEYGLHTGEKAPGFETLNAAGETVSLDDFLADGPVVLVFYRGGWCPYCNRHLMEIDKEMGAFQQRGVSVVGISVDQVGKAAQTIEENNLSFEVITNPDASILKDYNLAYKVPKDLVKMYKNSYDIDLEAASGQKHHLIAVPAVFIIDAEGTVRYVHADDNYKVRMKPKDILKEIDQLDLKG